MNNPKDKAGDLIVKFLKHSRAEKDIKPIQSAKQCALIAVDEILEELKEVGKRFPITSSPFNYYEQVKKEINNL